MALDFKTVKKAIVDQVCTPLIKICSDVSETDDGLIESLMAFPAKLVSIVKPGHSYEVKKMAQPQDDLQKETSDCMTLLKLQTKHLADTIKSVKEETMIERAK